MHVDPILKKSNGTTLLELWKNDTTINDVTIYELLHMKGGLNDYDDTDAYNWTLTHPDEDITPLDYLYELNKTFECQPNTCLNYSSNGYSLLTFALANHYGADSWDTFD